MDWTFVTPENSYAEALAPHLICIWRWSLWEVIRCPRGHEGEGPHDVIIILMKRGTETGQACSLLYEDTRGLSPGSDSIGNIIFNPPSSRTMRNRCPLLFHSIYMILLQKLKLTSLGWLQWSPGNPFHILRISRKNRLNITTHSIYTIKLKKFVF